MATRWVVGSVVALVVNVIVLAILVDAVVAGGHTVAGLLLMAGPIVGIGLLCREWISFLVARRGGRALA